MALQVFEVKEILGVDRNAVEGSTVAPQEIKGFQFRRNGGVEAGWGAKAQAASASLYGFSVDGYDQAGLASMHYNLTNSVFDGSARHDGGTVSSAFVRGHVALAGLYNGMNDNMAGTGYDYVLSSEPRYNVRRADGAFQDDSATVPSYSATAVTISGASMSAATYRVEAHSYVQTNAGLFTVNYKALGASTAGSNQAIKVTVSGAPSSNVATEIFVRDPSKASNELVAAGTCRGNDVITVSALPVGTILGSAGAFTFLRFAGTAVPHQQRVYGVPASSVAKQYGGTDGSFARNDFPYPPNSVVYSDLGYVQRASMTSYFQVGLVSGGVTGLASTPAGLLVFGENETFIMRGDPEASNFSLSLVSAELGHDSGAGQPATIGGTTLCIYKGEVYRVTLGMGDVDLVGNVWKPAFENLSRPVWTGTDFVQVAAETRLNQIVARTSDHHVFRFDLLTKKWLTDPFDGETLNNLLPNPDSKGTRYLLVTGPTSLDAQYVSGAASGCEIKWSNLMPAGSRQALGWRRLHIHTNASYSGTATLTYTINGATVTTSAESRRAGEHTFYFQGGLVSERADLQVDFPGMVKGDTVDAPVEVEAAPRYRLR